jgi:DNA-binding response OmpR family regulator
MQNHTRPTRFVLVGDEVNSLAGRDGDILKILSKSAGTFSYIVCHVQHVREMFSLSSENEFDVILHDVSNSRANGFAALEGLCEAFSSVPVIVIVERDEELTRRQALNLGALDVLQKSTLSGASLFEKIQTTINRKKTELGKQQQMNWESALNFLQHNAVITRTSLTPETLNVKPLCEAMPYKFLELTKSYSNLLDLALTRTRSGVRYNGYSVSRRLHFLASDLGSLRAGVWDVIDIHAKAVGSEMGTQEPNHTSHKILLELISDLVSYYRHSGYANA